MWSNRVRRIGVLILAVAAFAAAAFALTASEQDTAPNRYDENESGRIDFAEFEQAVFDYYDGDSGMTQDELIDLEFRFYFDIPVATPMPSTPTPEPTATLVPTPTPTATPTPSPPVTPEFEMLTCLRERTHGMVLKPYGPNLNGYDLEVGDGVNREMDITFVNPDDSYWYQGIYASSDRHGSFIVRLDAYGEWAVSARAGRHYPKGREVLNAGVIPEAIGFRTGAGERNQFTLRLVQRNVSQLWPQLHVNGKLFRSLVGYEMDTTRYGPYASAPYRYENFCVGPPR